MKTGIMQPYFLPYLGYFQLMNACDVFVIYDNIKFTKKGWIHRNRMLLNGRDQLFSLPLKSDSDFLNIDKRAISDDFDKERNKILGQIRSSYGKAPYFSQVYPLVENIFNSLEKNLFQFIFSSITSVSKYLSINTPVIVSSNVDIDHTLKGKDKVMELCRKTGGNTYINPIGGLELYDKEEFKAHGIDLYFHKMRPITYPQNGNAFVPYLSILDVLMFNDVATIQKYLLEFDLL